MLLSSDKHMFEAQDSDYLFDAAHRVVDKEEAYKLRRAATRLLEIRSENAHLRAKLRDTTRAWLMALLAFAVSVFFNIITK